MPTYHDPNVTHEMRMREEWDEREFWATQEAAKRAHEQKLAELRSTQAIKVARYNSKAKAKARILLTLVRLPVSLLVVGAILALQLAGRLVPPEFYEFLNPSD